MDQDSERNTPGREAKTDLHFRLSGTVHQRSIYLYRSDAATRKAELISGSYLLPERYQAMDDTRVVAALGKDIKMILLSVHDPSGLFRKAATVDLCIDERNINMLWQHD